MPNNSAAVQQQRKALWDDKDYYPTPEWVTRALLEWLQAHTVAKPSHTCWEPAAGGMHMVNALKEYFTNVWASDKHDHDKTGKMGIFDFVEGPIHDYIYPDWVITNPPFKPIHEFIANGNSIANVGTAFLARIAFLEGIKRYTEIFSVSPPTDVLVFVERVNMSPGEIDLKKSSSVCFAWYVWQKHIKREHPHIHWVPPGSRERLTNKINLKQ